MTDGRYKILSFEHVLDYYDEHDLALFLSADAVQRMKGDALHETASEILGFLAHRGVEDPLARYLSRNRRLSELQQDFEATGRYRASRYDEVEPIDLETYKLSLLLSFVLTVHRFEILEALRVFLARPGPPNAQRLLSIGFGTGYELKLAREMCPAWEQAAYDSSPDSVAYAAHLLSHFGFDAEGLKTEWFPLETDEGLDLHQGRYGKIVICEVLEHLEQPARALENLRACLHPDGEAFLTMAINLAQEDHIFLYPDVASARDQVKSSGFAIVQEWVLPVAARPFQETDRERIFRRGNYACIATRDSRA